MRLRGSEDAHGAVWLLAVGVEVRVVVGIVIVEAESLAQVCKGYFPFSLGKHGESVFRYIILYCRREHLLQSPYTRIIICSVELLVSRISLVEIKFAVGRIVQPVLLSKLYQVCRCQEILFVVGVILAVAALVSGHEILVLRHPARQPSVSSGILQIPCLLGINKTDAETFRRPVFLNQRSQSLHTLTCCMHIGQNDIVGTVLRQSVLHIRVCLKSFPTAEDSLCGTHSHSGCVISGAAPLSRICIVRQTGITEGFLRQRTTELTILRHELLRSVVGILVYLHVDSHQSVEIT